MKNLKTLALAAALIVCSLAAQAASVVYSRTLVSETGLAYNNTYSLDMGSSILPKSNIDSLSMQAVYSSTTFSAKTFTDGVASTGAITVASFTGLQGAQATDTITVAKSTTVLTAQANLYFTLNGYMFASGDLWSIGTSSATTAASICSAINSYGATSATFVASTTSAGVCTITVISSGTNGNNFAMTTSSAAILTLGGATFSGGKNHGFIVFDGQTLTEGTDFTAITSSHVTAGNIKNAINAHSVLGSLVTASTSSTLGVVAVTAAAVGTAYNYGWWASSSTALTMSNLRLYGGTDSAVDTSTNKITITSHAFTTGLPLLYTKTAGTNPANLNAGTTYYAIRSDANSFKLATSQSNSTAGTAVSISTQSAAGSGSFTLTPLALTGVPSFKWQNSNDNSNWTDVSVSSVTMTSLAAASTTWDFGSVNYRYIRLNVVAPTTGGIGLVVTGIGKSNR